MSQPNPDAAGRGDDMGQGGAGGPSVDGLQALLLFARRTSGADIVLIFEAGHDGVAMPLASEPEVHFKPFSLGATAIETSDWSDGAIAADTLRLPSAVLTVLSRPVQKALFVETPVVEATRSGVLLLWYANSASLCECAFRDGLRAGLSLLTPAFSQMLTDRRALRRRRIAHDRFDDLFESVPAGIIVLEGNGQSGLVNEMAAKLLGIEAGERSLIEIAAPMRALRESCRNAESLMELYSTYQRHLDYAAKAVWDLGERKYEVDTHPILGNGRNGRIWMFHDVTAQHVMEENLRQLASTDALTGLSNRRHFFEAARRTFSRTLDGSRPVTALMIDIDHFKSINDRFGHPAGDEVLRAVATRIRTTLREPDLVARLGGEEFAVLLEGLTLADAVNAAERVRNAIGRAPVSTSTISIDVRVSIGLAERRIADGDIEHLLGRADRALYEAKGAGRNRVVSDDPV